MVVKGRFFEVNQVGRQVPGYLVVLPYHVVFGSGNRLRFAAPRLQRVLIDARIGIETMDTAAACRTYNVLLGEGRCVVAALLFDAAAAIPVGEP